MAETRCLSLPAPARFAILNAPDRYLGLISADDIRSPGERCSGVRDGIYRCNSGKLWTDAFGSFWLNCYLCIIYICPFFFFFFYRGTIVVSYNFVLRTVRVLSGKERWKKMLVFFVREDSWVSSFFKFKWFLLRYVWDSTPIAFSCMYILC